MNNPAAECERLRKELEAARLQIALARKAINREMDTSKQMRGWAVELAQRLATAEGLLREVAPDQYASGMSDEDLGEWKAGRNAFLSEGKEEEK